MQGRSEIVLKFLMEEVLQPSDNFARWMEVKDKSLRERYCLPAFSILPDIPSGPLHLDSSINFHN